MGLFSKRKKIKKAEERGGLIGHDSLLNSRLGMLSTRSSVDRLGRWNPQRSIGDGLCNRSNGKGENTNSIGSSLKVTINPPTAAATAVPPAVPPAAPLAAPPPPVSEQPIITPTPAPPFNATEDTSLHTAIIPATLPDINHINSPIQPALSPVLPRTTLSALSVTKINSRRNSNEPSLQRPSIDNLLGITENKLEDKLKSPVMVEPISLNKPPETPKITEPLSPQLKSTEEKVTSTPYEPLSSEGHHPIETSPNICPINPQRSHPFPYNYPPPNIQIPTIFYDKNQQTYYEIKPFSPEASSKNKSKPKGEILGKILDTYGLRRVVVHPRFIFCFLAVTLYYTIGLQGLIISFILTLVILEIKIETIQSFTPRQELSSSSQDVHVNGLRIRSSSTDSDSTRFEQVFDSNTIGDPIARSWSPISRLPSPILQPK